MVVCFSEGSSWKALALCYGECRLPGYLPYSLYLGCQFSLRRIRSWALDTYELAEVGALEPVSSRLLDPNWKVGIPSRNLRRD
jgi:hypothetical protein